MGSRKKIIGLIAFPILALLSIFAGAFVMQQFIYTKYSSVGIGLSLVIMLWWFIPLLLLKRGRKVMVTPILLVDEWHEEFKELYRGLNLDLKIGGPIGKVLEDAIVEAISNRAARSQFALCEEGVVLHPLIAGATLFRWNDIHWYRANIQFRYFDIKVGYTGKYSFWTLDNFDAANKILSEHVPSR